MLFRSLSSQHFWRPRKGKWRKNKNRRKELPEHTKGTTKRLHCRQGVPFYYDNTQLQDSTATILLTILPCDQSAIRTPRIMSPRTAWVHPHLHLSSPHHSRQASQPLKVRPVLSSTTSQAQPSPLEASDTQWCCHPSSPTYLPSWTTPDKQANTRRYDEKTRGPPVKQPVRPRDKSTLPSWRRHTAITYLS